MEELDELRGLFGELRDLMVAHDERNWIRAIEGICYDLWDNPTADDLKSIKWSFFSMYQGVGSFDDYHIPGNQRVDQIINRAWQIFSRDPMEAASDRVVTSNLKPAGMAQPFSSHADLLQYSIMPIYWNSWSDRRSE